jgi:hypothetical protein
LVSGAMAGPAVDAIVVVLGSERPKIAVIGCVVALAVVEGLHLSILQVPRLP